ncbi:hypothetical protein GCM10007907_10400 [Chitinimonas prasina]|uniref:Uncharacterized protein n=1 Tax=Chitinimonas prasina TaxID=1434937 RepID=A0ABQ5YFX2_9NEIS|nr:hypothetical protein GCM10007907_10400 [Chitinimonas prasina]
MPSVYALRIKQILTLHSTVVILTQPMAWQRIYTTDGRVLQLASGQGQIQLQGQRRLNALLFQAIALDIVGTAVWAWFALVL